MTFGERLTILRKERDTNQKEFALNINIEGSKYNKWENDKNRPDFETVCYLAKYFNVTTDYLLGNSEYRNFEDELAQKQLDEKLPEVDCIQDKNKKMALAKAICAVVENSNSITQDKFLDCIISISQVISKVAQEYYLGSEMLMDAPNFPGMDSKDYRYAVLAQILHCTNAVDSLYGECLLIIKDTVTPLKEIPQAVITDYIDGDFLKNYNNELLKPKKEV